jgi:Baculoviridae AC81
MDTLDRLAAEVEAANNEPVPVELCCQAIRRCWGLADHYFLRFDGNEYHLGNYRRGRVLPIGTTKGAHVTTRYMLCRECHQRLAERIDRNGDAKLFASFFPLVNCETFCRGFSLQATILLAIPVAVVLVLRFRFYLALVVVLLVMLLQLACSKYRFSRTDLSHCPHLKEIPRDDCRSKCSKRFHD